MRLVTNPLRGSRFNQYLATITGCFSTVSLGMHFGWPSPSLPQLLSENSPIPMTSEDGSWIATMPCIGEILGALIAAIIADKIGRKNSMMLTSPLYFLGWILVAYSQSVSLLNVARFISGISDGIVCTVFPIYLGEIADVNIRGLLGSSITVTTLTGILLINVIGSCWSIKTTALLATIFPILHFISFYFMPESPYYLLMKNKPEQAERCLKIFKNSQVTSELNRLQDSVKEDLKNSTKIFDLFTIPSNRKAMFIMVGLRAAQQTTGNCALIFYVKIIFQESGFSEISPHLATNIYLFLQLVCSGVSSLLTDKLGRRPLLIFSILGSGLALLAEGSYFLLDLKYKSEIDLSKLKMFPLIALLCYIILFDLGMMTISILMSAELFPTSVKALALCLADIYFGILVTLASKFFQIMKDNFGLHVPFLCFAGCSAVGLMFIVLLSPRRKGRLWRKSNKN